MREPYFARLAASLTERGVSVRYIDRLIAELEDHCADAAADHGNAASVSSEPICERLGDESLIVSLVMARPELRGQLSGLRVALRSLRSCSAGWAIDYAERAAATSMLMRWSASIACGTMITAALLLVMAQTIAPSA